MGSTSNKLVLEAIDGIESADSVEEIAACFMAFVGFFGFEALMIGQLVNPALVPKNKRLLISNWPNELREQRAAEQIDLHDPVGRYALKTKSPFTWQEAYDHANRFGRKVYRDVAEHGYRSGMMFPVHSYDAVPGGVSIGSRECLSLVRRDIGLIDLVAQHAYVRLDDLIGPFPHQIKAQLSKREIEVVHYAAAGKTNWEIGEILGISEFTVRDCLKILASKLETSNRTHTVAVAIAQNHIMV